MKRNKMIKVLFLIQLCRDTGKHDLALKLIKRYKIDKVKLEESYYD